MKQFVLAFVAALSLAAPARTQGFMADGPAQPLSHSESPRPRVFFAPLLRLNWPHDQGGLWPGARMGWTFRSAYFAGLEGYVMAKQMRARSPNPTPPATGVGGFMIEAVPAPGRAVHAYYSLLVGAGGTGVAKNQEPDAFADNSFLVVEPRFGFEFRVSPTLRICPGIGHLWISGDLPGARNPWEILEASTSVTFKFMAPGA